MLDALLKIDPYAEKSGELKFCEQDEDGKPNGNWKSLGSERFISLKEVKKYYQKLGSYLHTPTPKKVKENGWSNLPQCKKICLEIVEVLDEVFASPIYNIDIKEKFEIKCVICDESFLRRVPVGKTSFEAECLSCSAKYRIKCKDKQFEFRVKTRKLKCPSHNCNGSIRLPIHLIKPGIYWTCSECSGHNQLTMGIAHTPVQKNYITRFNCSSSDLI